MSSGEPPSSARFLGIDMGGTNLRYSIVTTSGNIVSSHSEVLPAAPEERALLPVRVAEQFRAEVDGVGLAIAGTVRDGVLTWSANLGIQEIDFGEQLRESVDGAAIVLNDARAAGLAEAVVGAGAGADTVLSLTVGTGIGGAIVIGDKLLEGTGDAGEVGHMVIDPAGPACTCGRAGCWERFVGGRALHRVSTEMFPDHPSPLEHLIERAERGNTEAMRVIDTATGIFGRGVDNICAILAPDTIVLGGGIMARNGLVARRYREVLRDTRWGARSRVVDSVLGDSAGRIGAALAASQLV
ncbi:MAG: ROK family protein [Leucobacter sp.]